MFNFNQNDRDHWSLTERDLPPESAMAQEPRLRGLAENPVFRMTTMRLKRGVGHRVHPMQLLPGLFVAFAHVFQTTRIPLALRILAGTVLGCIVIAVILTNRKRTGTIDPLGGNLDRACRVDLYLAGVPPGVVVNGRWGSMLNRRRTWWERVAMTTLYFVGLAGCVVALALGWDWTAFAVLLPLTGFAGLLMGYARHPIPRALHTIKFQTRSLRDNKEWGMNWRAAMARTLRRLWWIVLLCVAVGAAVFAVAVPALVMITSTNDPIVLAVLLSAGIALCALGAPWAGAYAGRRLDRKRDEMHREAVEDSAFLLEMLRIEEFERTRAGR